MILKRTRILVVMAALSMAFAFALAGFLSFSWAESDSGSYVGMIGGCEHGGVLSGWQRPEPAGIMMGGPDTMLKEPDELDTTENVPDLVAGGPGSTYMGPVHVGPRPGLDSWRPDVSEGYAAGGSRDGPLPF